MLQLPDGEEGHAFAGAAFLKLIGLTDREGRRGGVMVADVQAMIDEACFRRLKVTTRLQEKRGTHYGR